MLLLEVNNLHASYSGCLALRGVSLEISQGELVGLCGPNKAGKSTLAKCLAGSKLPDVGNVVFDGRDITYLPCFRRLALGLSLCPEGRGIYSEMSVNDNLRLGADGLTASEARKELDLVLSYFPKLANRRDQRAGSLSGGEAQMLGIARKLLRRPRLLIVDEPALGLSPIAVNGVFQALGQIRKESGVSVLIIEEMASQLAHRVDRVVHLNAGEIRVNHAQSTI
jgi:branched-chain amino acid transport system ATP-binding protein